MSPLCQMSQLPGLTLMLVAMSTGSPLPWTGENEIGNRGGNPRREIPEIELQLEDLKGKNEFKEKKNDAPPSTPGKNETLILKSELNLEKPTVSDNSAPESILEMGDHWEKREEFQGSPSQHLEISYTPHDIAEYIFWTGDEMGVALLLSQLIENHIFTKDAVIKFLELVKEELQGVTTRYVRHGDKFISKKMRTGKRFPPLPESRHLDQRTTGDLSPIVKMIRPAVFVLEDEKHKTGTATAPSGNNSKEDENDIWTDFPGIPQVENFQKEREYYSLDKEIQRLAHELFSKATNENPQLAMQRLARFVDKLAKM